MCNWGGALDLFGKLIAVVIGDLAVGLSEGWMLVGRLQSLFGVFRPVEAWAQSVSSRV